MKALANTDKGIRREQNEDYYYISDGFNNYDLYMLADGMGGYKGGEIASKLAIEAAKQYIDEHFNTISHDKESILKLILESVEYANNIVLDKSKNADELEGMGTTLEVCLIYNNRAYIGHIGDSRIYRIRNRHYEETYN